MRSIIYFACPTELIHLHRVIHLMPYQVFTLKPWKVIGCMYVLWVKVIGYRFGIFVLYI